MLYREGELVSEIPPQEQAEARDLPGVWEVGTLKLSQWFNTFPRNGGHAARAHAEFA